MQREGRLFVFQEVAMSMEVHRKLKVVPVERKWPGRLRQSMRALRRSQPRRFVRKEGRPWPKQ